MLQKEDIDYTLRRFYIYPYSRKRMGNGEQSRLEQGPVRWDPRIVRIDAIRCCRMSDMLGGFRDDLDLRVDNDFIDFLEFRRMVEADHHMA